MLLILKFTLIFSLFVLTLLTIWKYSETESNAKRCMLLYGLLKTSFKVPWTSANANITIPSSSFGESSLLSSYWDVYLLKNIRTLFCSWWVDFNVFDKLFSVVVDFFFEAMGIKFYITIDFIWVSRSNDQVSWSIFCPLFETTFFLEVVRCFLKKASSKEFT